MKNLILFLLSILSLQLGYTQEWIAISGELSGLTRKMHVNPEEDRLYLIGSFGYIGEEHFGGFASYNGSEIENHGCAYDCTEPIVSLANGPISIASYQGYIYTNGAQVFGLTWDSLFNMIPGTGGVIKYADFQVEILDEPLNNSNVNGKTVFYVVNEELYILKNHSSNLGGFTGYGGVKYDGVSWEPFMLPMCVGNPSISGLIDYQGTMYISGDITSCEDGLPEVNDIMRLDENGEWEVFCPPIPAITSASIYDMKVYQDELYVCGPFHRGVGNNVGECIMKWNGEEWSDLGSGLVVNELNNIVEMVIVNDELVVCGRFEEVGGILSKNLAKWDGNQWCAIDHDFTSNYIRTIGVYHDELYVHAKRQGEGSKIWKWTGQSDTCSAEFNSIGELSSKNQLRAFPNPSSNKITVEIPGSISGEISTEIYNALGIEVSDFEFISNQKNRLEVDVSDLLRGFYTLVIKHEETVLTANFIKE